MYFFLKHKLIFIALFALGLNLIFGGVTVHSVDLSGDVMKQVKAGGDAAQFSEAIDPRLAIMGVVRIILAVTGIVFTVLIVYGGYNYFTSQGEEEKAEKGSKIMRMAIIGLIIILFSYSITLFIGSRLPALVTEGGEVAK
ncbi:MAG: hypothetical protein HY569_02675 [Candidatus Magasanikbacteria bacterium]|nr:hypothetical protein [Candidatus Magasanikbacteria bacterium]